jgi:hypothetical protein
MDPTEIHKLLVKGMRKQTVMQLAKEANEDTNIYRVLLDVISSDNGTPAMKASWVLGNAARLNKAPAQRFGKQLLQLLITAEVGGVQRELLKVLEVVALSEEDEGKFVDTCFALLRSPGLDVGIRYYCLRILRAKAKKYPDLKPELISSLEEIVEWHNEVWKRHTAKAIQALEKISKKK